MVQWTYFFAEGENDLSRVMMGATGRNDSERQKALTLLLFLKRT